jgi:hypothetical protein
MTIELKAADGGVVQVSPEILQAFKAGFAGAVLGPDDAAYDETRTIWNAMIDRRPGLILRCSGTADIVQAVRFARQHQFLISVRGGGHNIAGLAVCDGGLMIDLSLMKGVWVDPVARTARAQPGCTLGNLDRETQLHGLAAVLGFVSATGIAGLTVGGGFGYLTRQYGWTCDNLVSMELVTADGALMRTSADENADLFWALRGGGGNFGIVTSFEYRLFPVGPEILGGAMAWRLISIASSLPRRHAKPPALLCCASHRPRPGCPRTSTASRSSPSLFATAAASKRARPSWRRCANWGNPWPTSSRAGPTARCRACSTPPSPRGGATTGSRTTWRASTPRPLTC